MTIALQQFVTPAAAITRVFRYTVDAGWQLLDGDLGRVRGSSNPIYRCLFSPAGYQVKMRDTL